MRKVIQSILRNPMQLHAAAGVLLVLALAIDLFGLHTLNTIEYKLCDVFMRHHAKDFDPDPNIVVVDIDDQSLAVMEEIAGLYPWPREIHADLLDALSEFSPKAVVFDLAFRVRDRRHPKSDARLSASLNSPATKAYLAATLLPEDDHAEQTRLADVQSAFGINRAGVPNAAAMFVLPNAIDRAAWRLGLDNSIEDADGVSRRYRLAMPAQGWMLPSLPARVAADMGKSLPSGDSFLMSWPEAVRTHYSYGALYKLLTEDRPAMSAQDVRALDQKFRGKIIFVGSSATSSFDHHLTPQGAEFPGVDILATAVDNLVNDHTVRVVSPVFPFLFGVLMIAALVVAFAYRYNPLTVGAFLAVLTICGLAVEDQALVRFHLLPLASPLIFAWCWFLSAAIAGYLRERRSREQTVSLLGRFLNPAVVRKIVDQGETVESMSGHYSNISVLFSDIRGFTTLSESREPHEVVNLLNRYFDRQVEVVFKHGGTLDKFIGDCIMAFWGAPLDDPEHAGRAVAAAMEMQDTLLEFKKELAAEQSDMVDIDVGIGVHSGRAVVGFIGARRKLDYTAIGDTVNLSSRIEGLTKGVARVLVSKETMIACGESPQFDFALRGAFDVKGRAAQVELYEPIRKHV